MKKDKETDSNSDQGNRAPLIVAMVIFVGFFAIHMAKQPGFESSHSYHDYTEEEIAHIDTVTIKLPMVPRGSILQFQDGNSEIIAYSDKEKVTYIGHVPNSMSNRQDLIRPAFVSKIKRVVEPGDDDFPDASADAVLKYVHRGLTNVDLDTVSVQHMYPDIQGTN